MAPLAHGGGPHLLRTGVITAFKEVTPSTTRNLLLSFACRHTMMESSALHRCGPNCRPKPRRVLGGPYLKLADAETRTAADLVSYIEKNCTNQTLVAQARKAMRIVAKLPSPDGNVSNQDFQTQLAVLYPPLHDGAEFNEQVKRIGPRAKRTLVLRGILGGLARQFLRSDCGIPAGTIVGAEACLRECHEKLSATPAKWWTDHSGQRGRKRRRDN